MHASMHHTQREKRFNLTWFCFLVRECGNSDFARARLLIRSALNDHSLNEYISSLAYNKDLTRLPLNPMFLNG